MGAVPVTMTWVGNGRPELSTKWSQLLVTDVSKLQYPLPWMLTRNEATATFAADMIVLPVTSTENSSIRSSAEGPHPLLLCRQPGAKMVTSCPLESHRAPAGAFGSLLEVPI